MRSGGPGRWPRPARRGRPAGRASCASPRSRRSLRSFSRSARWAMVSAMSRSASRWASSRVRSPSSRALLRRFAASASASCVTSAWYESASVVLFFGVGVSPPDRDVGVVLGAASAPRWRCRRATSRSRRRLLAQELGHRRLVHAERWRGHSASAMRSPYSELRAWRRAISVPTARAKACTSTGSKPRRTTGKLARATSSGEEVSRNHGATLMLRPCFSFTRPASAGGWCGPYPVPREGSCHAAWRLLHPPPSVPAPAAQYLGGRCPAVRRTRTNRLDPPPSTSRSSPGPAIAGEGVVKRTPVVSSTTIGERVGGRVVLKAENIQSTGSFKIRGALSKLHDLGPEAGRGVVAGSAGNHAQAVAFAARHLGVRCEIFVPEGASISKTEATRAYGATVCQSGETVDAAVAAARARAAEAGMAFIHPFDDAAIVAGQATLGVELAEDVPDLRRVIVPVGGGGLAAGVAIALKRADPGVTVVGVQVDGVRSLRQPAGGRWRHHHAGRWHRRQAAGATDPAPGRALGGRHRDRGRGRSGRRHDVPDGTSQAVRGGRRCRRRGRAAGRAGRARSLRDDGSDPLRRERRPRGPPRADPPGRNPGRPRGCSSSPASPIGPVGWLGC